MDISSKHVKKILHQHNALQIVKVKTEHLYVYHNCNNKNTHESNRVCFVKNAQLETGKGWRSQTISICNIIWVLRPFTYNITISIVLFFSVVFENDNFNCFKCKKSFSGYFEHFKCNEEGCETAFCQKCHTTKGVKHEHPLERRGKAYQGNKMKWNPLS